QFKSANRLGARFVIVYGESEYQQGKVTLKDMTTGKECLVDEACLFDEVQKRL
ncbi:MAG: His/Gly/Thr/Pro-type tRNA ligase C-terminal domain-containing protein, partial [Limnochordia bacterium]|nr:His/Gly/Thr/Pro-type tRNA ligase C-terminal domain-containing protein [Limnochordia bacterium]